ncbi:phosphate ABC transporter permease PstA [Nesterenkonia flava]|uniref:Phosphate transport system permease protein PstA n=1 Tax=Nesterenkonia flava TaxID=469799 RepID=A0ABU1FU69_9MICC|nr:phosphate ABC transporter permease PstA [Nesterenkonia flava]MDR5712213.1 phosphate ABC transporter permease PstA [Nesterenkonia flava]
MSESTRTKTPTPASVDGPAGALQEEQDPTELLRPNSLTGNIQPRWFLPACAAAAIVLGFALMVLFADNEEFSINWALWFIFAAIIHLALAYFITLARINRRKATDMLWRNVIYLAFVLALLPLVSVIMSVAIVGVQGLTNAGFLTSDMQGINASADAGTQDGEHGVLGGIRHAIIGSLIITVVATLISVPVGLLTSIYLVEYSQGGPLSRAITFFVDVMTGIPSIVAGLFGAAAMTTFLSLADSIGLPVPGRSTMGVTAAIALSVLMIPVVVRTTEEMLRVVPNELREASYALGVRKWRTILKVVIPTAISGIAAGVTLAIARVIGETAPILLTAGFATRVNWNPFEGWMTTLPVFIYQQFTRPLHPTYHDPSFQRAWAAALVLILIVMALNLIARIIATIFAPKKTGR